MQKISVGFIGAGGIAKAHAFSLNSLKFYYPLVPKISFEAVTSLHENTRNSFAEKYGFNKAQNFEEFLSNQEINTVFILGPNNSHFAHLEAATKMPSVTRIYIEKPVCATLEEELHMKKIVKGAGLGKQIQVGFQLLQMSAIREALKVKSENDFGKPIHFHFTLKHSDYLKPSYREKRITRLTPAPDGGAMADLGSHAISLAIAFLGDELHIVSALQGGSFPDVSPESDLYSEIAIYDKKTGAVGTISASRITSGTGDLLAFEIAYEKGTIKFSSNHPDHLSYFLEKDRHWADVFTGSNFLPATSFPSTHVPGGWLRSMIHAHYQFLIGDDPGSFIPDLHHGLSVQRLVRETAQHMKIFRAELS
jgi:predicted dehydrogenase